MPGDASVQVEYRYEVVDNDGHPLAQLPLACDQFNDVLSGIGNLTATLPLTHSKALRALIDPPGRELVVSRNDNVVWNGPITLVRRSSRSQTAEVSANQLTWYLHKTRLTQDYTATSADTFDIVRDLIDIATGEAGGQRFAFGVSAGASGVTIDVDYKAEDLYSIGEILDDLAADPTDGFDYRLDVSGTSARDVARQLTLGSPSLGSTVVKHKLETGNGLYELVETLDLGPAGNQVHLRPGTGSVLTLTNAGSLAAGHPSLHAVLQRPDLPETSPLVPRLAQEFRRRAQPPVRAFEASYAPRAAVPYGWCQPGDLIGLYDEHLQIDATRRVERVSTVPPTAGRPELVSLSMGLPLDELGS